MTIVQLRRVLETVAKHKAASASRLEAEALLKFADALSGADKQAVGKTVEKLLR
jgi:hypothetical protein